MAKIGERGPAGQKKERVAHILARSRKFVPIAQIRAECIKEWGISTSSWQKYWQEVSKYLERVTLRQARDYKGIVLGQLESLLPECTKTDNETGEVKRDVVLTSKVLGDIRDLLGLDAPKSTIVEQTTSLELSIPIQALLDSPKELSEVLADDIKFLGQEEDELVE